MSSITPNINNNKNEEITTQSLESSSQLPPTSSTVDKEDTTVTTTQSTTSSSSLSEEFSVLKSDFESILSSTELQTKQLHALCAEFAAMIKPTPKPANNNDNNNDTVIDMDILMGEPNDTLQQTLDVNDIIGAFKRHMEQSAMVNSSFGATLGDFQDNIDILNKNMELHTTFNSCHALVHSFMALLRKNAGRDVDPFDLERTLLQHFKSFISRQVTGETETDAEMVVQLEERLAVLHKENLRLVEIDAQRSTVVDSLTTHLAYFTQKQQESTCDTTESIDEGLSQKPPHVDAERQLLLDRIKDLEIENANLSSSNHVSLLEEENTRLQAAKQQLEETNKSLQEVNDQLLAASKQLEDELCELKASMVIILSHPKVEVVDVAEEAKPTVVETSVVLDKVEEMDEEEGEIKSDDLIVNVLEKVKEQEDHEEEEKPLDTSVEKSFETSMEMDVQEESMDVDHHHQEEEEQQHKVVLEPTQPVTEKKEEREKEEEEEMEEREVVEGSDDHPRQHHSEEEDGEPFGYSQMEFKQHNSESESEEREDCESAGTQETLPPLAGAAYEMRYNEVLEYFGGEDVAHGALLAKIKEMFESSKTFASKVEALNQEVQEATRLRDEATVMASGSDDEKMAALRSKEDQMTAQIETLVAERNKMNDTIVALNKEINDASATAISQQESWHSKVEDKTRELIKLGQSYDNQKTLIEELEREVDTLRRRTHTLEDQVATTHKTTANQIETLTEEKAMLEQVVGKLEEQKEAAKVQAKEASDRIVAGKLTVQRLEDELVVARNQYSHTTSELAIERERLRALEMTSELLAASKTAAAEERETSRRLEDECDTLKDRVAALEQRVTEQDEEITLLFKEKNDALMSLGPLRDEIERNKKSQQVIDTLEYNYAILETQYKEKGKEFDSLSVKYAVKKKEHQVDLDRFNQTNSQLKDLQAQTDTSKSDLESAQFNLKSTTETLKRREKVLEEITAERDKIKTELDEIKHHFHMLQSEQSQQSATHKSRDNEINQQKLEMSKQLIDSVKLQNQAAEARNLAVAELEKLKSEYAKVTKERDKMSVALESIKQVNSTTEGRDAETRTAKKEVGYLNAAMEKMTKDAAERDALIAKLQKDLLECGVANKMLPPSTPPASSSGSSGGKTTPKKRLSDSDPVSSSADDTKKGPVIMFTGFRSDAEMTSLQEKVMQLGGSIRDDGYDASITHIVTNSTSPTMKTISAALSHNWLMCAQWVLDSAVEGQFLPED
eukprot:gene14538-17174_t